MLILITLIILFLSALALLILRLFNPDFRYAWLIAVTGAFLAWISVLFWQLEMNDTSPIIAHNKENEKYSECRCTYGEEINRDDILSVVTQKCTPGLRWRCGMAYHVL